ncbi:MAG: Arabinose operon regulatory protein [Pseudomonadota bacterium]|jgi:AraC family transcriptional activator of pobA
MSKQPPPIQTFSLFGESTHLPDVLHCETIADRSVLHDWELTPHRHARLHQILLIQTGGGTATLDGQSFPLHVGSLVNVPIGHVHAFRFQKDTQGWVTTFADEFLDEVFMNGGNIRQNLQQACVLDAEVTLQQIVQQIWQEYSSEEKGRTQILRGLSAVLLGLVARQLESSLSSESQSADSNIVLKFKALIEKHYTDHWPVSTYAKALAISPTHLTRLTKAMMGVSASRFIEARIMKEARRNLAYTHLSISTIAYALGYTDPAYFSRVFTRDAGISPKSFRAKI